MVLGCLALGGLLSGSMFSSPSAGAGLFLSPPSLLGGGVWDEVEAGAGSGTSFKLGCVCVCHVHQESYENRLQILTNSIQYRHFI